MSDEGVRAIDQERLMAQLLASAERELSAFFRAVNQLFGAEQARKAANNWIKELERMDWPGGASVIGWRKVTIAAAANLVRRGEAGREDSAGTAGSVKTGGATRFDRNPREKKSRSNAQ
jgi:hypothetical protein